MSKVTNQLFFSVTFPLSLIFIPFYTWSRTTPLREIKPVMPPSVIWKKQLMCKHLPVLQPLRTWIRAAINVKWNELTWMNWCKKSIRLQKMLKFKHNTLSFNWVGYGSFQNLFFFNLFCLSWGHVYKFIYPCPHSLIKTRVPNTAFGAAFSLVTAPTPVQ